MVFQKTLISAFSIVAMLVAMTPLQAAEYVPGLEGAVEVPFSMDRDGKASLGIYNPGGQLMRIVFQGQALKKGSWIARWDGMDHWGKLLPTGSTYEARVYSHGGVKVFYEFALGHGDWNQENQAWLTKGWGGEGLERRQGGWMSDHGQPRSVVAVGDRVFYGTGGVEHGDGHVGLDLQGNKLWGKGGLGAVGPNEMVDLDDRYVLQLRLGRKGKAHFQRFDSFEYSTKGVLSFGKGKSMLKHAYGNDFLHVLTSDVDPNAKVNFVERDRLKIDYQNAEPQVLNRESVQFQISPQGAFGSTFGGSGHFQVGSKPKVKSNTAYYILPLTSPFRLGTVAHSQLLAAEHIDLYVLKAGVAYQRNVHSPFESGSPNSDGPGDDLGIGMDDDLGLDDGGSDASLDALLGDAGVLHDDWIKVGHFVPDQEVNLGVVNTPETPKTNAVMIRYELKSKGARKKLKKKGGLDVRKCTLYSSKMTPHTGSPKLIVEKSKGSKKGNWGWLYKNPDKMMGDAPGEIILDYGEPVEMDGLYTVNQRSKHLVVEVLDPEISLDAATDEDWSEAHEFRGYDKKYLGFYSTRTNWNIETLSFSRRERTRYLRLRYLGGIGKAKVALRWIQDDPFTMECKVMMPIVIQRDTSKDDAVLTATWRQYDLKEFKQVKGTPVNGFVPEDLVIMNDRDFFSLQGGVLHQSRLQGKVWKHEPVSGVQPGIVKIRRIRDMLGITYGNKIQLIDPYTSQVKHEIGDGQDYAPRGPWLRDRIKAAKDFDLDKNNKLWLLEASYHPKRTARFDLASNRCEWSVTGGPEYGGGGYLDPDLNRFYYQGMQFSVDWSKGESHLTHFNDRMYTQETPTQDASSFGYTKMGYILERDGRKYVASPNGSSLAILEDNQWRPVAVVGSGGSPFLNKTKKWASHWKKQDLKGKQFIWYDKNEDGNYQIEEVTILDKPVTAGTYWPSYIGPDLAIWSGVGRLAPSRFLSSGVPVYEASKLQKRPPLPRQYTGSQAWGSRAKGQASGYGEYVITPDGYQCFVGQPYVFGPDLQIIGGEPDTGGEKTDGFQPEVRGTKIEHTLHFVGTAKTESKVGYVGVQNGNNGQWSIVTLKGGGMLLDQIFTGEEGSWSTDLKPVRGMDVTGRKFATETFFGHFVGGQDGNHYIIGGKSYHALCRVEGLNDINTESSKLTISESNRELNAKLRERLVEEWRAYLALKDMERSARFLDVSQRIGKKKFKMDGTLTSWGGKSKLRPIDEPFKESAPDARFFFDMTWDEKGLYIVYTGKSFTKNSAEEPGEVFKKGFGFDFRYRTDTSKEGKRAKGKIKGDRKLVFAKVKGKWSAVMFDYLGSGAGGQSRTFSSPWVSTDVAGVRVLDDSECKLIVQEANLAMGDLFGEEDGDDLDLGSDMGLDIGGDLMGGDEEGDGEQSDGRSDWSAEVFVTWKALGFKGKPYMIQGDVGVQAPDSGGNRVDERQHWALPQMGQCVSDVGVEVDIRPGKWGTLKFSNSDR